MREACWTCRNRTIQCDRTSTPCAKCKKAGLQCFDKRPLRWVQGVAIRGKMRGHVLGEDTTAYNEASSAQLLRKRISRPHAKLMAIDNIPSFALRDPHLNSLNWASRFYLDYYNTRIAKLYILYDSEGNPFRHLLSYAMDDSTLRQSILALAARHFANTGRSFDNVDDALPHRFINANLDALHFKKQAIKKLSLSLSHPQPSQKDAIMATILLLIFLDLLESGIEGWKYHLHGAEGIINRFHSPLKPAVSEGANTHGDTVKETRRFIARQFSLISTIGGALSDSMSKPETCVHFEESRHQESIVRSFLGCPEFLLRAIRYFSNQRHAIEIMNVHDETLIHDYIQDTLAMLKLTADFDCLQWASDSMESRTSSTVEIRNLALLSEAYKTAAVLYGNRHLRAFEESTRPTTPDTEELVLRLLGVIDSLKCDAALFKCLLWPTFIAGLECQTHSAQTLVTESLRMLWDSTSCLNVINASSILRNHWLRMHSDGNLTPEEFELHVSEQGWLLI